MSDIVFVPARTALVNVDIQQRFVDRAIDGMATLGRINKLADTCRSAQMLVVHTSHVLRPDGSNMGILGELLEPIRDGALNKGASTALKSLPLSD